MTEVVIHQYVEFDFDLMWCRKGFIGIPMQNYATQYSSVIISLLKAQKKVTQKNLVEEREEKRNRSKYMR